MSLTVRLSHQRQNVSARMRMRRCKATDTERWLVDCAGSRHVYMDYTLLSAVGEVRSLWKKIAVLPWSAKPKGPRDEKQISNHQER